MALDLKDLYTTLELPSVIKDLERIRNIEPGYIADMLNYVIYDFKQIWNGTETKEVCHQPTQLLSDQPRPD